MKTISWGSNVVRIAYRGGRVMLLAGRGVRPFIETVHELAPQAEVSLGWQVALQEKIRLTRSGFRRG